MELIKDFLRITDKHLSTSSKLRLPLERLPFLLVMPHSKIQENKMIKTRLIQRKQKGTTISQ